MDATRADVEFTAEVCAIAVAEGAGVINIPDTVGYTTPGGVHALLRAPLRAGARAARRAHVGPLPRRSRPRRRQLLRRAAGRRPPGRVRDQRAGGEGRQLLAGGDRDAAAHAARRPRPRHDSEHDRDRPHQPHGQPLHRLRRAAEQGDRRPQRLRARVRDPPGRRAQGALDLRDHGRARRRARLELDRARQAQRPPRAQGRADPARLQGRGQRAEPGLHPLQGARRQEEAGHGARSRGDRLRRDARGLAEVRARLVRGRGRQPRASRWPRSAITLPSRRGDLRRVGRRRPDRLGLRRDPGRGRAPTATCASSRSRRSPAATTRSAR